MENIMDIPERYHPEEHVKDVNSHRIFGNVKLTCQFLREYTGLKIFENIREEDIEDVTERYYAFLGVEFEADSVKRIKITIGEKQEEIYVIPLIEHKSMVDFDVSMQLLRYMVVIWHDYKQRMEGMNEGCSKTKAFRYPLIIPIVYYEGEGKWTASLKLSERISHSELVREYVPDFCYKVIEVHNYTDEELERHPDEISLVMRINKVQNSEDYREFLNHSRNYVTRVYKNAPEDIRRILQEMLWSLMVKLSIPQQQAREIVEQVRESGNMGYLFENADFSDIQKTVKEKIKIENEIRQMKDEKAEIGKEVRQMKDEKKNLSIEIQELKEKLMLLKENGIH